MTADARPASRKGCRRAAIVGTLLRVAATYAPPVALSESVLRTFGGVPRGGLARHRWLVRRLEQHGLRLTFGDGVPVLESADAP